MTNAFNEYFENIGKKTLHLKLTILTIILIISSTYIIRQKKRLKFKCITENETTKVINILKMKRVRDMTAYPISY